MASLSLLLDHLKVDKLSKINGFFLYKFFGFVLYTENVNAVGNIPYKDNEHPAVKCVVIHSPGTDGVLNDDP